jgi:hypothetical protein
MHGLFGARRRALAAGWLAVVLSSLLAAPVAAGAPSGEALMRAVDERDEGEDVEWQIEMTLIDRQGQTRTRTARLYRKKFVHANQRQERQVTVFLSPANIRKTGLLSFDNRGQGSDDDIWLYLPALKKLRRIPASERGDNFVGTDFTYEDVKGGFAWGDYTYTLKGEQNWTDGGQSHKVYALEARPRTPALARALGFTRTEILVRPDVALRVQQKFYDAQDNLDRTLTAYDIRQVDGIWTFLRLEAENHETRHKTVMALKSVRYNQKLADDFFNERTLLSERVQ